MKQDTTASDWAAERGEKWRTQLSGLEAMMRPIDEPLIRALCLDTPCRVADIGCGGGGTTLEILRHAPSGSMVHGFDISPALIESARARVPAAEHSIAFYLADMSSAAPPQEPYDRLVSRFGIMFYDDPPGAFANVARWLAPGGRFAFAAWGLPSANPWMTILRDVTAEIVEVPRADPEAPGPFRYADAKKLLTLLDQAGFSELEVVDWKEAIPIGGGLPAAEAAHFALASFSSFGELLAEAGTDALDAALRSLTERLLKMERDGIVRMDACVHIFTGRR